MLWAGEIVLQGKRHDCRVLEISQHGALLSHDKSLAVGTSGILLCEGLDVLFEVLRSDEAGTAVAFVDEGEQPGEPFDVETVTRSARNQQVFRYLASGVIQPCGWLGGE